MEVISEITQSLINGQTYSIFSRPLHTFYTKGFEMVLNLTIQSKSIFLLFHTLSKIFEVKVSLAFKSFIFLSQLSYETPFRIWYQS